MQSNEYEERKERYILNVFELVTYKKNAKKWMPSTLYWERKGHNENLYNEYFIVSQEPRNKKRKKLVYIEKFLRYQNVETPK